MQKSEVDRQLSSIIDLKQLDEVNDANKVSKLFIILNQSGQLTNEIGQKFFLEIHIKNI